MIVARLRSVLFDPNQGLRPFRAFRFFRDLPRVYPYLRPYRRLAAAAVSLIGVSVLVGLVTPWPLAILVDTVLGNKPLPSILPDFMASWDRVGLLVFAVVAGLLITAIENAVTVVNEYVTTKLDQSMVLDLRSDLFGHAQKLSLTFHDSTRTGGLMYRINEQAGAVGAITVAIPPLAQSAATLVGMFVIAYKIDPQLALLSLTVVPFIYYSTGFYASRIEPRIANVMGLESRSLSIVYEAMQMLRVIVAFGREHHEHRKFREQSEVAVKARVDLTVRQTMFSLGVNTITAAGTALVLGFGGWHVMQRQLTVGELLVVMGYIAAVYQPLQEISANVSSLQERFIALRGAMKLLDTEPEVKEKPDAVVLEAVRGDIAYEHVFFDYKKRSGTLKDVTFEVAAGQCVGIVGPTGAGKTTLISLVPRFYDPIEGRILFDGVDLRELSLDSLRAQISLVHQEPLLFSGTIGENIRYGRLEASDDEVVEAAQGANAHDFISRLPQGYETELGERGAQLSGGERQRIAVARAFLKDAPILILDEPTSSIDSKTEAVILEALERLMVGRTTFMIAHRLSTLRSADLILVMNHGEIVERGSHEELLAADGLYRQLWEAQTRQTGRHAAGSPANGNGAAVSPDALRNAIRLLLQARPEELSTIASDPQTSEEARFAAQILESLAPEELARLRRPEGRGVLARTLASFLARVREDPSP